MSETPDTGAGAGDFEQEFDAAREAQLPGDTEVGAVEEQAAEGEPKPEGDKPPLSMEEIRKRLNDQQGATREERQRRRALEQEVQELRAKVGKPAEDGEKRVRPNPQEDPIGYLEYVEEMLQEGEQRQAAEQQQTEAQRRVQAQMTAVVSAVEEHENDFRELTPDYDAAAEHLYQTKKAEYAEEGMSDAEAHAAVMSEFLTRSDRALKTGKNPAEIVYNLAKKSGYAPKGGEEKLDAIERGQKRTSPLSGAGAGGRGELTMESVSKLSGAAFDSAYAKLQERARQIERSTGY